MNTANHSPKKNALRLIVLIILALGCGASLPLFYHFVIKGDVFAIKQIRVDSGSTQLPDAEIQFYAKSFLGQPLYDVSLKQIAEKIEEHPFVQHAEVSREPPNALRIRVTPRKALFIANLNKPYLVDEEGEPFLSTTNSADGELPLLSGLNPKLFETSPQEIKKHLKDAASAIKIHRDLHFPGGAISELSFHDVKGLKIYFKSGIEVALGFEDFSNKWKKFASILALLGDKSKELAYVNLSKNSKMNRVAVRFTTTQH